MGFNLTFEGETERQLVELSTAAGMPVNKYVENDPDARTGDRSNVPQLNAEGVDMTLHITINDQTEQALREQAAAAGQDLSTFLRDTLERQADAETLAVARTD